MDTPDQYTCACCGKLLPRANFHKFRSPDRKRPVTSRCRDCRRDDYYKAHCDQTCACCTKYRPLDGNGMCRSCNENSGIRECSRCSTVLPLYLSFYGRSRVCKTCSKSA